MIDRFLISLLLVMLFFSLKVEAGSGKDIGKLNSDSTLSGNILINIYGDRYFSRVIYQYILSLPDKDLELVNMSRLKHTTETERRELPEKEDERFKEAFSAEAAQMEELMKDAFAMVDRQRLGMPDSEHFTLMPNQQLSYAVILPEPAYFFKAFDTPYSIIDLNTLSISNVVDKIEQSGRTIWYYRDKKKEYRPVRTIPRYPLKWSPNGRYLAVSLVDEDKSEPFELVVIDMATTEIIFRYKNPDDWIEDIVWSPDSKSLAVLCNSVRIGLWPWDLLGLIAGHPTGYMSFYLEIIDIKSGNVLKTTTIHKNITYGSGRMLWVN